MKRTIALVLIFIFSFAFAQYEDFDLAKFKLPDWKYQYLNFRFEGNSDLNAEQDISTLYDTDFEKRNSTNTYGYLSYGYEKNTKEFQKVIRSNLRLGYYSYNNTDSPYFYSRYRSSSLDFDMNIINRRYINPQTFFEADLYLDLDHSNSRSISGDRFFLDTTVYRSRDDQFFIPIKLGKGRIEPVDDANRAVFILEALEKAERIKSDISEEEIIDFANFIAGIRSEKIFDSRIANMERIQDIHHYLNAKGYVELADAIYFTTLDDMWRYSGQNGRYSGKRTAFSIRPGIFWEYDKHPRSETYTMGRITTLDIGGEYNDEKPINLNWQESVEATAYIVLNGFNRYQSHISSNDYNNIINFNVCLMRHFTYTPNTRTEIDLYYGAYYASGIAEFGESTELLINDSQLIQATTGISAQYYISPRVTILGGWDFDYTWAGENWRYSQSYSMPLNEMSYYTNTRSGNMELQSRFYFRFYYSIF